MWMEGRTGHPGWRARTRQRVGTDSASPGMFEPRLHCGSVRYTIRARVLPVLGWHSPAARPSSSLPDLPRSPVGSL